VYITEKAEIVRVTRLSEERDTGWQIRSIEPPDSPVIYRDIRFRVETPETFQGREIVLPIIRDTEGPLFERREFTIRIPPCFLEGKRSSEKKRPDGTREVTTTDGLGFEGILVTDLQLKGEANQAAEPTRTSGTPPADAGDRASGARGSL